MNCIPPCWRIKRVNPMVCKKESWKLKRLFYVSPFTVKSILKLIYLYAVDAGSDTTAIALTHALYYLIKSPTH